MDWDTDISEEAAKAATISDFELLPDGVYTATVKKLEKDNFTAGPNSKIPSCPMAIVHLLVKDAAGHANYWRENVYLYDANQWRILKMFTCFGLRRHGDGKTRVPWNDLEGSTGRVKVGHRVNRNDPSKVYNQVQEWLEPASEASDEEY